MDLDTEERSTIAVGAYINYKGKSIYSVENLRERVIINATEFLHARGFNTYLPPSALGGGISLNLVENIIGFLRVHRESLALALKLYKALPFLHWQLTKFRKSRAERFVKKSKLEIMLSVSLRVMPESKNYLDRGYASPTIQIIHLAQALNHHIQNHFEEFAVSQTTNITYAGSNTSCRIDSPYASSSDREIKKMIKFISKSKFKSDKQNHLVKSYILKRYRFTEC